MARRRLPTASVYVSDQASDNVTRACELLRMNRVPVQSLPDGTMDPEDLRLQTRMRRGAGAVRRIPYTWIRQTRPGGVILATVGAWSYGTGLARLTVDDGTATGSLIGRASFMPARAHALEPLSGDLAARAAYADTERSARLPPDVLDAWMPAFLAPLAAPGTRMVRAVTGDGGTVVYLFDTDRESFATLTPAGDGWTARQGEPVAAWEAIEEAITVWQDAGQPGIDAVRMRMTSRVHTYEIPGASRPPWEHAIV